MGRANCDRVKLSTGQPRGGIIHVTFPLYGKLHLKEGREERDCQPYKKASPSTTLGAWGGGVKTGRG